MSTCSNCKTKLSCGCQKRTASNGVSVCSTCLPRYEAALKTEKTTTAPTNVSISYPGAKDPKS
jgi:hypothetical protein